MKHLAPSILAFCGLLPCACAQSPDEIAEMRKEIDALRQTQRMILGELQAMRELIARGQNRQPAVLNLKDSPVLGSKDAKVTIVEYSDYQCGFCARHFRSTLPKLNDEYIKAGKVKYILRNFPLESIHPKALKAAAAALCAGEQGKYWEMHRQLFSNPSMLDLEHMPKHAEAIQIDAARFSRCLDGEKYVVQVRREMEEGRTLGVEGTPTFFIGLSGNDPAKFTASRNVVGAQPYEAFKAAIDSMLN